MPTSLQFRRGTTAQNNAFTGAAGELSVDTQLNVLRVHDGSVAGGYSLMTGAGTVTITNKTINAMSTKISQSAATQDISFVDLIGTSLGDSAYCGAKTYTISPSLSFLTLSETTLTLSTTNVADVCNKTITLTVALAEFGLIPVLTKTFTV